MLLFAALRIKTTQNGESIIIPCIRHGEGYKLLRELDKDRKYKYIEEGFINNKNIFMNREESLKHAIDCGQLSQTVLWNIEDQNRTELYSEDLY